MSNAPSNHFVRLRGLPYSATEDQIRKFFEGLEIVANGITFTSSTSGRPSGECYCEFGNPEDAQEGLKKDRQHIGNRYVEVFDVGEVEMDQVRRRSQIKSNTANQGFIRVRGLPYNCTREDIVTFFQGLNVDDVVFGKESGSGSEGRPTGEGVVSFDSTQASDRALQLNGKHLGSRYLEIFKIDGGAFQVFKERSSMNIVPLRSIAPLSGQWGYGPPAGGPPMGRHLPPPPRGGYDYGDGYGDYDPYYGGGGGYGDDGGYNNKIMGLGKARPLRGQDTPGYGGGPMGGGGGNRYSPYAQSPSGRGGGGGGGGDYSYGYGRGGAFGGGSNGGGGGGGYPGHHPVNHSSPLKVFIRGLPFRVTSQEIEDFFAPMVCVSVHLGTLTDGRSSGDGIVEFETQQEASQALQKDRKNIGTRYVELFPTVGTKIPTNTHYELVGGQGRANLPPERKPDRMMMMQQQQNEEVDDGGYGYEQQEWGGGPPTRAQLFNGGGGGGPGAGGYGSHNVRDYSWPASY